MDNHVFSPDLDCKASCARPSRRAMLGLGLASILMSWKRQSHASSILIVRAHSPQLESRVRHWRNILDTHPKMLAISNHPKVAGFRRRLTRIPRGLPHIELIKAVNSVVNVAAPYVSDYQSSFVRDRWASPVEFLLRGGDCEDFALTKAAALSYLGWSPTKMYLAIGELDQPKAKPRGHAVLVTVLGDSLDNHLVLSNGTDRVVGLKDYSEFKPVYGVEDRGALMFVMSRPHHSSPRPW